MTIVSWNRGKGRVVYPGVMRRGMKVHRSVRARILDHGREGNGKPYRPRIRCTIGDEVRPLSETEWLDPDPKHFKWVD